MILDNHQITIKKVADDVGISFGSCQAIFTNVLGMNLAATKLLNFEQLQLNSCHKVIRSVRNTTLQLDTNCAKN